MVTSATGGEGKTFVSANLAAGLSRDLHAHALLVDCDLRVPLLGNLFGFSNKLGLSDYLKDGRKIADLLLETRIEKLSLLPGGNVPENPTELIGSRRMEDLVLELKSRYNDRYVIFDSTPLLAASESEVLSKLVDGIIIVVKAGVTPRETVKQAISFLDKEKILGLVLNHLEFRSPGLHSRYFGSSGYY
jgi:exopolysaccharide/PEP-CTERM locus tyrosine autokinase